MLVDAAGAAVGAGVSKEMTFYTWQRQQLAQCCTTYELAAAGVALVWSWCMQQSALCHSWLRRCADSESVALCRVLTGAAEPC